MYHLYLRITLLHIVLVVAVLCFSLPSRADEIDALVAKLGNDSYKVRVAATRELIKHNIDHDRLNQLIAAASEPEIRHRLQGIIKVRGDQWVKLTKKEILKLEPSGGEDGKDLYLASTVNDGSTVIGKYLAEWEGANFPIGTSEVLIKDFKIWTGNGIWSKWQPGMENMIAMGKTKEGKWVYAVRAKWMRGIHQGTLIESEDRARIPWGGDVQLIQEFEVLTADLDSISP